MNLRFIFMQILMALIPMTKQDKATPEMRV